MTPKGSQIVPKIFQNYSQMVPNYTCVVQNCFQNGSKGLPSCQNDVSVDGRIKTTDVFDSYSKDGLSVFLIMQYSHIIFTIIFYSQSTIIFNQKICGGSQLRTTGRQINTRTLRQILGGKQILPAGNRYKCGGSQSRMTM